LTSGIIGRFDAAAAVVGSLPGVPGLCTDRRADARGADPGRSGRDRASCGSAAGSFATFRAADRRTVRAAAPRTSRYRNANWKSEKVTAAKAKARAARTARERKAAKRAAQVRRAKERSAPAFGSTNQFGNDVNQLGGTFRQ
jgi:hypothetical protein